MLRGWHELKALSRGYSCTSCRRGEIIRIVAVELLHAIGYHIGVSCRIGKYTDLDGQSRTRLRAGV